MICFIKLKLSYLLHEFLCPMVIVDYRSVFIILCCVFIYDSQIYINIIDYERCINNIDYVLHKQTKKFDYGRNKKK